MGERRGNERSAIIFGARNLGRAAIETLVADGWAVAGVARPQATLDGVRKAGALALEADVTDPASVHAALEEAASAQGGIDLAVNAAAAYGGARSGPFGVGPIASAEPGAFSRTRSDTDPGHRRLRASCDAQSWALGGRIIRGQGDHQRGRPRAPPPRYPGHTSDHRRRHPTPD